MSVVSEAVHAVVVSLSPGPGWTHIRLTKTGDKGTLPDHPIFEGYTVWGHCKKLPVVGERFQVLRYQRNDVECLGLMTTSPVVRADNGRHIQMGLIGGRKEWMTFETANSSYRLDFLRPRE